jgi:hypothetical protein
MPRIPPPTCYSRSPTRRSKFARPEPRALLLTAFAGVALAQPPLPAPKAPPDCGSVVIVRCDRPRAALSPRRAPADPLEFERIVIEADPVRRSLEEALGPGFSTRPAQGTHSFATAEGGQCTCMNRCPPPPLACCSCSVPMNRYSRMPGSSPLR